MDNKELIQAEVERVCVILARFNGNLDYHQLSKYRQESYQILAKQILFGHGLALIDREELGNTCLESMDWLIPLELEEVTT